MNKTVGIWFGWFAILLAGCGGISDVNMTATVDADKVILAEELATLNSDMFIHRTEIFQTVAVKETELAQLVSYNQMLGATLAQGSTPTHVLQLGIAQPDRNIEKYAEFMAGRNVNPTLAGSVSPTPDLMVNNINALENRNITNRVTNTGQIIRLGVASRVDPATDCPSDVGTTFPTSVSRLYVVMRANNLPMGSPLAVIWYYGDEIRVQDTWVTPREFDGVCIWFVLERNRTAFTAGDWSVQLFLNRQPIEDRLRFTLTN